MKIVLATYGSLGDVQPMLALALVLKREGHRVLLAGPPEKAGWAGQLGCPFHPLGRDVTAFIDGMKDAHSLSSAVRFVDFVRKELNVQFESLPEIITGAEVVVGSSLVFALSTLAEFRGIPYRYIAFAPQLLPSGHHPMPAFKTHGLPPWYNRLTWKTMQSLDKFTLTRVINRKRNQLGLNPVRDAWRHILGEKVIVASDRVIAEVPPDVEPAFAQTGYMHLDQPDQELPQLDRFLKAGPPPIYAGFGSMPMEDQARNVPTLVGAARSAGQRIIIAKFWDGPSEFYGADDVFFIQKYPHLKLFPHMAAVIHHGGAGTTASTAISGVPQIIVPHALDQYYWGHRVYHSNLGPKPIWRSRLTCRRLASAIRQCLSESLIKERARSASEEIKSGNSLEMAVNEIMRAVS